MACQHIGRDGRRKCRPPLQQNGYSSCFGGCSSCGAWSGLCICSPIFSSSDSLFCCICASFCPRLPPICWARCRSSFFDFDLAVILASRVCLPEKRGDPRLVLGL